MSIADKYAPGSANDTIMGLCVCVKTPTSLSTLHNDEANDANDGDSIKTRKTVERPRWIYTDGVTSHMSTKHDVLESITIWGIESSNKKLC
jgi:hypothetical protein